jgi:uncharacterized repeat protein (TIGR01451 family)
MALQSAGEMSFADVYNEITGESLQNPPISITLAELGQLQNASGQTIPLNQNSPYKPDGILPTVFPDEWYRYCQTCGVPKPFLQITKQAATTANAGEFFNYFLTVTNNGEASTSGNITIYDTIPNNIIISSVTGSDMTYTVVNQNVTITYTGSLGVGQSASFYIIIKTFYSGTYYNQASCVGGGDNTIRYSNTTVTSVNTASYTATKTERRDRTLQRNNCGDNGTGSFVQVWSPYFTNTYTSFISQADADAQATALSVTQANNWLDANAQAVANAEGTCGYQYPDLRLVQSLSPSTINRFQTTTLNINIKNLSAFTNGTLTLTCALPAGLNYSNLQNAPSGWSFSVNNNIITMTTTQQLSPTYNADFRFTLVAVQVGSFSLYTFANGGNIANPPVNSNFSNITINQEAIYNLTTTSVNYDYNYQGFWAGSGKGFDEYINAVPGDNAYYAGILTINNSSTGTDELRLEAFVPSHIPSNYIITDINTTYFEANIFPTRPNVVVFTSKGFNIPAGQYNFAIKLNLPFEFYSMFTTRFPSSSVPRPLTVFETGVEVSVFQPVTFYFYKNLNFTSQATRTIRWFNNYRFRFEIRFSRNPSVSGSSNIWAYFEANPFSPASYAKSFKELFPITWNNPMTVTAYHKDPTRGTDYIPDDAKLDFQRRSWLFYFYLAKNISYGNTKLLKLSNMKVDNLNANLIGNITVQPQNYIYNIFEQDTDLDARGNHTAKAINIFPLIQVNEDGTFDYGAGIPDP